MPPSSPLGTLYGLSVGPGDPELLTLKSLRILQSVPIVAFPKGAIAVPQDGLHPRPGFAESIIQPYLQPQQQRLPLAFPYVLDPEQLHQAWQVAAQTVWPYLAAGQDVAFACEGDASFFSTFNYLAQTLQTLHPAVPVQVVPGVCSPLAAAAALGVPLTLQKERLAILPTLYSVAELDQVLSWAEVVVLMKVRLVYPQVWEILRSRQLLDHCYAIEWATLPQQKIHRDLQDKPDLKLPYFSVLVVQQRSPLDAPSL